MATPDIAKCIQVALATASLVTQGAPKDRLLEAADRASACVDELVSSASVASQSGDEATYQVYRHLIGACQSAALAAYRQATRKS